MVRRLRRFHEVDAVQDGGDRGPIHLAFFCQNGKMRLYARSRAVSNALSLGSDRLTLAAGGGHQQGQAVSHGAGAGDQNMVETVVFLDVAD
jgi:hypothetical protein